MRRFLLILCLILALLVSCATGKAPVSESEVETDVVPIVVEEPAQVEEAPEEQVPSEEIVFPEEEEMIPEGEEVISEDEEQFIPEEQVTEDEIPSEEISFELVEESQEPVEEQDWSQEITATAPGQEAETQTVVEESTTYATSYEGTIEEEPVVSELSPDVASIETEEPAAIPGSDETDDCSASEKSQSKPSAKNMSFVDKLSDLVKKAGAFIVKEKLFSLGLFVCFIGIVYLIIALIISSVRSRREDSYYHRKPVDDDAETMELKSIQSDTEPASEDDEFLRSLLGNP